MMLTKLGISGRIFPNPGMPAMPLTNFFREVFPRTLTKKTVQEIAARVNKFRDDLIAVTQSLVCILRNPPGDYEGMAKGW